MCHIYDLITLDVSNEQDLEHTLEHKTLFSQPKIFDANGDLSKRWYVYFSYRHPETGKLKRVKNIYGKTNRYKTKEERYSILNIYKKRLLKLLKEGYNPFADNTELHLKSTNAPRTEIKTNDVEKSTKRPITNPILGTSLHYKDAFKKAIILKSNIVSDTTLTDYKSRVRKFEQWLQNNVKEIKTINQIERLTLVQFLNATQLASSARNRNNYRTVLSSLFQTLKDNEIIDENIVRGIKPIKTKPNRNKSYTEKEQKAIFEYLEKEDKILLLFIQFISYNFLRPIEICRLRVKDINLEQGTLSVKAKNKTLKTKIIPDILLKELPDLSTLDGDSLLFTPNKIGADWEAKLINRRDYFSKRFKELVKDHFGFNSNYGLYSFRHTFITKLYRTLTKSKSPFEAKSELMQITGHTTMVALEKYLRDIDAELPADYSELFK